MTNRHEQDPVLPSKLVEAINDRCEIGFLLGRHVTAAEATIAVEYCRQGDLVIPELMGWTAEDELGANAITHQSVNGFRASYQALAAKNRLLGGSNMSYPEYGKTFYRGLTGCGALVRFVEPQSEHNQYDYALSVLAQSSDYTHAHQFALEGLYDKPFRRALPAFMRAYRKEEASNRRRELIVRHGLANLLGDIVFGDILAGIPGPVKVRAAYGLAHHVTPRFFQSKGVQISIEQTMPLYQIPEIVLQSKSANGNEIAELDYARAMVGLPVRYIAKQELNSTTTDKGPAIAEEMATYEAILRTVTLSDAEEIWETCRGAR